MLDPATQQQVMATLRSAQAAADGVATLTRQAQPALARMPATLAQTERTLAATERLADGLSRRDGPLYANLDRIGAAAAASSRTLVELNRSVREISARVSYETLPRVNALADDVRSATQAITRVADTIEHNPRALLFGAHGDSPGPGEPGFQWQASAP
jgi:phospholipid/cholesterol/gamma-HCH transport system substrate-binding protein